MNFMEYQPTNREKKLSSKSGKFWCDICDAAIVNPGQKCPNCNRKQLKRKLKKS